MASLGDEGRRDLLWKNYLELLSCSSTQNSFVSVIDAVQSGKRNVSLAEKEELLKSCMIFPRNRDTIATAVSGCCCIPDGSDG